MKEMKTMKKKLEIKKLRKKKSVVKEVTRNEKRKQG